MGFHNEDSSIRYTFGWEAIPEQRKIFVYTACEDSLKRFKKHLFFILDWLAGYWLVQSIKVKQIHTHL